MCEKNSIFSMLVMLHQIRYKEESEEVDLDRLANLETLNGAAPKFLGQPMEEGLSLSTPIFPTFFCIL